MPRRVDRKEFETLAREVSALEDRLQDALALLTAIDENVDASFTAISDRMNRRFTDAASVEMANRRALLDTLNDRISSLSDRLSAPAIEHDESAHTGIDAGTARGLPVPNDFYDALEARFRGDNRTIADRQAKYVARVAETTDSGPFLDLGCGRGEFIDLLAEADIDAVGVDADRSNADRLASSGRSIVVADLLSFLRSQPASSSRGASMLQVAEHLDLGYLLATLSELGRVVSPNGVIIVETPNGANVTVAASTFWLDHTHVRPLMPEYLRFLFEYSGITVESVETSVPAQHPWKVATSDEHTSGRTEWAVVGMQELLAGDQDLTVIGTVPPP